MNRPLVCETVTATTMTELRRRRDAVVDADLLEVRLDTVQDPSVAGALEGRKKPVIVTCRPQWEGGRFRGSEDERRAILSEALALGAEFVDVEWAAGFTELIASTDGRRIVLSSHDFVAVPADLDDRARSMRATGAEVVKLAGRAHRLSDCLPLLALGGSLGREGGLVLIAMGERGLASRVLAARFNSAWTYAGSLGEIGQISPRTLHEIYRFRTLTEASEVYGLVGSPVGHSVSPAMHNAGFGAAGRDAVYLPFDAADADDFTTFARGIGLRGASVTIPFKVSLYERLDDVCDVARRVGAVNTIRIDEGRWIGNNTDISGFLSPLLSKGIRLKGRRASILGAGGSARAVAVALAGEGAAVTVHARSRERAEAVARIASGSAGPWPPERGSWDLLVNCTPIGMVPRAEETPLDSALLAGGIVYDLVYNPPVTRLVREAERAGCECLGGLEMLVAQAHAQFAWWTGAAPPPGVMRAAALKRLTESHLS